MLPHDMAIPISRSASSWKTLSCFAPLLLVALLTPPAQGQDFGTVFTSPEEREYLDYLRDDFVRRSQLATFDIQEDVIPDIPVVEEEAPVQEVTAYKFGGIMERRNGNRMVWLNGRQIAENDLPNNMNLTQSGLLMIRSNGMNYQLKPGESANLISGQDQDSPPSDEDSADNNTSPQTTAAQDTVIATASQADPVADISATGDETFTESAPTTDDLIEFMQQEGLEITQERLRAIEEAVETGQFAGEQ